MRCGARRRTDRRTAARRPTTALDRLREAQQKLERNQGGRGERDLQRAQRQAEELASEQKAVASDVNAPRAGGSGAGRQAKAQALGQRKDAMDAKVADLQQQLEKIANEMRRDEKDAARKLDEAAGSIRDSASARRSATRRVRCRAPVRSTRAAWKTTSPRTSTGAAQEGRRRGRRGR